FFCCVSQFLLIICKLQDIYFLGRGYLLKRYGSGSAREMRSERFGGSFAFHYCAPGRVNYLQIMTKFFATGTWSGLLSGLRSLLRKNRCLAGTKGLWQRRAFRAWRRLLPPV